MYKSILLTILILIVCLKAAGGKDTPSPEHAQRQYTEAQKEACENAKKDLDILENLDASFHGTYGVKDRLGYLRRDYNKLRLKYMIYDGLKHVQMEYKSYLDELNNKKAKSIEEIRDLVNKGVGRTSKYVVMDNFIDHVMNKVKSIDDRKPAEIGHKELMYNFDYIMREECKKGESKDGSKICDELSVFGDSEASKNNELAVLGFYNAFINSSESEEERKTAISGYKKALTGTMPKMKKEFAHFEQTQRLNNYLNEKIKSASACAENFNNLDQCFSKKQKLEIQANFNRYKRNMYDAMNLKHGKGSPFKGDFNNSVENLRKSYVEEKYGSLQDIANNLIKKRDDLTDKIKENYMIAKKRSELTQNAMGDTAGLDEDLKIPPLDKIYDEVFFELGCVDDNSKYMKSYKDPRVKACLDKFKGKSTIEDNAKNLLVKMREIKKKIRNITNSTKYQDIIDEKAKVYDRLRDACMYEKIAEQSSRLSDWKRYDDCGVNLNNEVVNFIELNGKAVGTMEFDAWARYLEDKKEKEAEKEARKKRPKRKKSSTASVSDEDEGDDDRDDDEDSDEDEDGDKTPFYKTKKAKYSSKGYDSRPYPLYKGMNYLDLNRDYFVTHNPTGGPPILTRKKNFLQLFTGALPNSQLLQKPYMYMPLWASEMSGLNQGYVDRQVMFAKYQMQQHHYAQQIWNIQNMLNWRPTFYNPYFDPTHFGITNPRVWPQNVYDYVNERGTSPLLSMN